MSNFEYIISSLPYLTSDYKYDQGEGFSQVIGQIEENLSEKDCRSVDFLLRGLRPDQSGSTLDEDFYALALKSRGNKFLREYFRFDLNLRNAKVRWLNASLGRDAQQDVLSGSRPQGDPADGLDLDLNLFPQGEFEEEAKVQDVLGRTDLLARERGIDDLYWEKIDKLSTFHYFDITAVLAYIAKLHIVDRWLALDEEEGRGRFRKLVDEVRGSFKGVDYKA